MPPGDDRYSSNRPPPDDEFDEVEEMEDRHSGDRYVDVRKDAMPLGKLRMIAVYQKVVLVCILIYFIAVVIQLALPEQLRLVWALGMLGVGLVSAVFVFLLCMELYGPGWALLCLVLTLIPCVGLITLLVVNGKATGILKRNGYSVGLLGARLSEFDTRDRD